MDGDRRLVGVTLRVDLEEPVEEPTLNEVAVAMHRVCDPATYVLALERTGVAGPPSIHCCATTLGWHLTRRGEDPTDVEQGRFDDEAAAFGVLVGWATDADGWRAGPEFQPFPATPWPPIDLEGCRWVRSPWTEQAIDFLYELNPIGIVLRDRAGRTGATADRRGEPRRAHDLPTRSAAAGNTRVPTVRAALRRRPRRDRGRMGRLPARRDHASRVRRGVGAGASAPQPASARLLLDREFAACARRSLPPSVSIDVQPGCA